MGIDPFEGAIPSGDPPERAIDTKQEVRYAGFWIRLAASIIDSILVMILIVPVVEHFFGNRESLSTSVFDTRGISSFAFESTSNLSVTGQLIYLLAVLTIIMLFWIYRSATPGKMMLGLKIVDAVTLKPLSKTQGLVRYVGYYVSCIFFLGFFWVGFDARKQGWHDKLARTLVIYDRKKKASA